MNEDHYGMGGMSVDRDKINSLLIISPDHTAAAALGSQLADCGLHALSIRKPEGSTEVSKKYPIQSVLLDLDIYRTSKEAISALTKSIGCVQPIPVVAISSSADMDFKLKLFELGISDYVTKPFNSKELAARIQVHMARFQQLHTLEKKNSELGDQILALEQMTITDALTGLYNKRYILDRLHTEIAHSARYKEPVSFIMSDIDHFKHVNDTFGHVAGDELLKKIADQIKSSIRNVDIAARYGGEEFLIICPNTDTAGAKILAERIRKKVHEIKHELKGRSIQPTLSLGIRSVRLQADADSKKMIPKLLDQADAALYRAKCRGRNRVEVYRESKDEPLENPLHMSL